MEDDIHPLVRLMAARMETHPEEFDGIVTEIPEWSTRDTVAPPRWARIMRQLEPIRNETEKALLMRKYRAWKIEQLHAIAMDELMNGPERRANMVELERQAELAKHWVATQQALSHMPNLQDQLTQSLRHTQLETYKIAREVLGK